MKCLMELDNPRFGLTQREKLCYLAFKFAEASAGPTCPVEHIFEPGMYIREMRIPAETLFIGRPHLVGHRCELVQGKILLVTEDAKLHLEAGAELQSKPGYMMCLYSKTPVIGRTYHTISTDQVWGAEDVPALEDQIFGSIAESMAIGESVRQKIHLIEGKAS